MAVLTVERRRLIDGIVADFLGQHRHGRTLLSVDGDDPSAAAAFAADLVTRMRKAGHSTFAAAIDGFVRPPADRRDHDAAESRWGGRYDDDLLRRVLVEPFRLAGSTGFVLRAFDVERGTPAELAWVTAGPDATVVLHGPFLGGPELRDLFAYRVWVEVEGVEPDAAHTRYLDEADPRAHATVIVDATDPDRPRRA